MNKKERLISAFNYLRINSIANTQSDVAKKMGSPRSSISSAFSGNERILTDNFIKKFCLAYDGIFNVEWILNGNGEMLKDSTQSSKYVVEQNIGSNVNQGNGNTITTPANNDIVGRLLDEIALQRQHSDTLAKQNQELIDILKRKINNEQQSI